MATVSAMFTITDVGDLNGRNLILNSHEEHSITVSGSGGIGVIPYYSYSDFASEFTHRKGQILTVSFDYETAGNTLSTGQIYAQHNESQIATTPATDCIVHILDNPSGHYSKTFTVTAAQSTSAKNTVRVIYKTCSPGTVIKINNIKVEIGDAATDWTPAPEDVVTAMTDAKEAKELANTKNSVYYQATAPTGNLKDGDTWFDTSNHYKISRWNVAEQNWIAAPLGDQAIGNLNASHINAGTLTAVDIEAGKAQDIAGTIKVYDENDAVKVSLDKDGLVATKGKIGNWDISSYSIQYQEDTPSSEDTVFEGDEDEQLIESGTPTLVGGATLKLKICTYDPNNPNLGPHIISSVVENGVAPQNDNGKTMCISNGGLACYYNRNNGVTGGSVSINPKLINVINADYDEDQVLWTDSANLNPGSLTIMMSKTENGEQTSVGRSFLTHRDLAFIGDSANPQLASGIAHWSVLAARRTIKDELGVTIYHCGNLFWAHFDGKMTVGWKRRMEEYISIYPNDNASLTNSKLCAPPKRLEKYCLPQSPANPRAIYRVFTDGRLGLYYFIPPTNGTNNYEVLTDDNWEPCDIFWAHIG